MQKLTFGELDGRHSQRAEQLFDACQAAGIDAILSDAIQVVIWEKFVFLSAFSGITALTRLPIGPLRADPKPAPCFSPRCRKRLRWDAPRVSGSPRTVPTGSSHFATSFRPK